MAFEVRWHVARLYARLVAGGVADEGGELTRGEITNAEKVSRREGGNRILGGGAAEALGGGGEAESVRAHSSQSGRHLCW